GVSADDAAAIIAGARCAALCSHLNCERNELLIRLLWATGARVSEALALTPAHVLADSVVMPTLKNGIQPDGSRPWRRGYMPAGPGAPAHLPPRQGARDRAAYQEPGAGPAPARLAAAPPGIPQARRRRDARADGRDGRLMMVDLFWCRPCRRWWPAELSVCPA